MPTRQGNLISSLTTTDTSGFTSFINTSRGDKVIIAEGTFFNWNDFGSLF